ncbi:Poly-beta-1,6-N-acetyl-D-glucosamine N-deacetylase [Paenibacillus allorhizoplanae]|uniref:Poly-beta-1,6-N-acetyl-D-glucosamine N-deacetylase n=1 Tax=Paenibacillus allorhizoplanae TaxID=2905648 RepID=A0ABM9BWF2_9BACL|nr:polysaccharide deacetylase family protein [Paenibacillus allorhizoplanae]CAH1195946.1 Poly-beta-1,6-N-acetyl-D-glucosamine N-deacetylase [Paenibacillus allorhizoplanae]
MNLWKNKKALLLAGILLACFATPAKAKHGAAIPVLNYHSIGVDPGNTYVLHPDTFARQMDYLAAHHYTPMTLAEFATVIQQDQPSPTHPVLLTFDDGYANNAEVALPILQKYKFPATLYLSTGLVGTPGYLTWPQIHELSAAGWDIASHTVTHPHLPKLSKKAQREEILAARAKIEQELGKPANTFAYPYGDYNRKTLRILKKAHFSYAFTTHAGWASSDQPPLELHRIVVDSQKPFEEWVQQLTEDTSK